MKQIKARVSKLIDIISSNKDKHVAIYEAAREKYRALALKTMRENLDAAEEGGPIVKFIHLDTPENHSADYERVLAMLDMHEEEFIEISSAEFSNFVMDRWEWSRAWASNTRSYLVEEDPE